MFNDITLPLSFKARDDKKSTSYFIVVLIPRSHTKEMILNLFNHRLRLGSNRRGDLVGKQAAGCSLSLRTAQHIDVLQHQVLLPEGSIQS